MLPFLSSRRSIFAGPHAVFSTKSTRVPPPSRTEVHAAGAWAWRQLTPPTARTRSPVCSSLRRASNSTWPESMVERNEGELLDVENTDDWSDRRFPASRTGGEHFSSVQAFRRCDVSYSR